MTGEGAAGVFDGWRTVPNLVTFIRLLCVPLFVVILFVWDDRLWAAILLAFLGATDWVDGWLARRLDQHSEFGKIFDPTADRLMFVVAILSMIIDSSVPLWFAIAVLVREILVSAAALVFAALGARRIDVTWWGKTGTFGLMFAFPIFLASYGDVAGPDIWRTVAWIIGIPSLIISWYAAATYVPLARAALREGRAQL